MTQGVEFVAASAVRRYVRDLTKLEKMLQNGGDFERSDLEDCAAVLVRIERLLADRLAELP